MRDLELGDFLLRGVARGVGRGMGNCSVGMNVALVSFMGVLAEGLDELIRINLGSSVLQLVFERERMSDLRV